MDFLLWRVIPYFSLITSVLVPFGILLHYWRRQDSFDVFPSGAERIGPPQEVLGVRRQIRRGRLASGIAFVATILSILGVWLPNRTSDNWDSFLVPIIIASMCVGVILAPPTASQRVVADPGHQIDLTPRSVWSFGRTWWFVSWIVAAVLLVATVLLAGLASNRDDQGRYAVLSVKLGNASASSTFPGWYFGVPILIGLSVLVAVTLIAMWATARPSLAGSVDQRRADVWLRRLRTRTVLSLGGGALILTLAWSLLCIGGGASVTLEIPAGDLGSIALGTPLAALVVPLNIAGSLLQGMGLALLLLPFFTKYPHTAAKTPPESPRAVADASVPASRA